MTMNTDRPSRPAERAPRSGKYPGQGAERLLILGGIGCLAFVALLVGVVVVGISTLIEIANKPPVVMPEIVDTTPPGELPNSPFELPVPRVPLVRLGNNDLNDVDPDRLAVAAQQLMQRGDFRSAVQCQYWSS